MIGKKGNGKWGGQVRKITIERNIIKYPAGSCLVAFGDTKVICTASISREVPPFLRDTGKGWVTAEYAMLPGSTGGGRKRRDGNGVKKDGRSTEIQRLIGRSLRAAVKLESLGEVTITIDCDVFQADGGTRTAAISGGWVALYDALTVLSRENGLPGPEEYLLGQVAAVSAGIHAGEIICDLDYAHDSTAEVDMNVVMRDNDLVEVQGTGEQGVFSRSDLSRLLDAAEAGILEIQAAQRTALGLG
jgi:ribonuclease PH